MRQATFNGHIMLTYNRDNGFFGTSYKGTDKFSNVGVLPEDHEHAEKMGVSPQMARLTHEICHHVVGSRLPSRILGGCSIVYRDAFGIPQQQPESAVQEFLYTTLQYHIHSLVHHNNEGLVYLKWMGLDVAALNADALYLIRVLDK